MAFADRPEGRALARAIPDAYLSRDHLDDVDGSCPVVGLATDVARSSGLVKRAYRQVMEMMAEIFSSNLGPNGVAAGDGGTAPSDERQRALAVVALCVGGMVLARAADDEPAADELRAASRRYALALAGLESGDE